MRANRVVVPFTPHHVILRGNNRRRLFSYARDFEFFVWCLLRAIQRAPCRIHAMSLMANHIHLLVTPEEKPQLSNFVASLAHRYATYRNHARGGSGKLFEERYKSIPMHSVEQLALTTAYIDFNAV